MMDMLNAQIYLFFSFSKLDGYADSSFLNV